MSTVEPEAVKRCRICGVVKPLTEFHRNRSKADGLRGECKGCHRVEVRAWVIAHPEKRRAARKREARSAAARASGRRYREQHPDRVREKQRKWRQRNPEKQREYASEYKRRHPERVREQVQRRRARLRTGEVARIDPAAIYERDRGRCHICGARVARQSFSLDHLIPIVAGGPHTAVNVAVSHRSCNSRRGPGRIPAQLRLVG